jgi:DNA-directed RNA polymerase delta subunit
MMAKVTKAIVDKDLRNAVFTGILEGDEIFISKMTKINDRQMGVLLTDLNGETRYVRLGAIVAELREDMTAEELMQSEIDAYQAKQDAKAEKAKAKAEKITKDKERRAKEKEEKENA